MSTYNIKTHFAGVGMDQIDIASLCGSICYSMTCDPSPALPVSPLFVAHQLTVIRRRYNSDSVSWSGKFLKAIRLE